MAFLDKLSALGKDAMDKASDAAEIAKCKVKITSAEADIKNVYTEIGKSLVENYADFAGENFPALIEKLNGFKAEIENLKAQIEAVKAPAVPAEEAPAETAEEAAPAEEPAPEAAPAQETSPEA